MTKKTKNKSSPSLLPIDVTNSHDTLATNHQFQWLVPNCPSLWGQCCPYNPYLGAYFAFFPPSVWPQPHLGHPRWVWLLSLIDKTQSRADDRQRATVYPSHFTWRAWAKRGKKRENRSSYCVCSDVKLKTRGRVIGQRERESGRQKPSETVDRKRTAPITEQRLPWLSLKFKESHVGMRGM